MDKHISQIQRDDQQRDEKAKYVAKIMAAAQFAPAHSFPKSSADLILQTSGRSCHYCQKTTDFSDNTAMCLECRQVFHLGCKGQAHKKCPCGCTELLLLMELLATCDGNIMQAPYANRFGY